MKKCVFLALCLLAGVSYALHIGDLAPDFKAQTAQGELLFYPYIDKHWAVLFSHPGDFTPVCTTELVEVANLQDEFKKRNVKVIGLSVDSVDDHKAWLNDLNQLAKTPVDYPIIADEDKKVSMAYDMIHPLAESTAIGLPLTSTVRSVFIIGPDKKIKAMITYPMNVGRNFNEILRLIDALQYSEANGISTPANWMPGEKVIIPNTISDEKAHQQYPQGFESITPYLRLVKPKSDEGAL